MDLKEIQKRLDALAVAMAAKGLRGPQAEFQMESDTGQCVMLTWRKDPNSMVGSAYEWFRADVAEALDKADAFVAALPSPEEHHRNEFMHLVGDAANYGRQHGIDSDFVNPLTEAMKRLSANAIAAE